MDTERGAPRVVRALARLAVGAARRPVGQAVVRWYKYDVFLPAQGDAQAESLGRALDAIS